jgi:hypothetical protein
MMEKRRIIGTVTVLIAFPYLFLSVVLTGRYDFPIIHWFILEKLSIVIFGVIGGVLLWNGRRIGYILSLIAWIIIFEESSSTLYHSYFGKGYLEANALLNRIWRNYALLEVIPSILIVFVLIRDLFTSPKIQRNN